MGGQIKWGGGALQCKDFKIILNGGVGQIKWRVGTKYKREEKLGLSLP